MKRYAIALVVLLAMIVAGVIVARPAVISERLARAEITARMSAWTGRPVTFRGELAVFVFPFPGIEAKDVVVSGMRGAEDDPPLITIPSLKASLKILPLLGGRLEVGTLTLVHPRVHLVRNEAGKGNWSAGPARGRAALDAVSSRLAAMRLGEIVLRDGAIVYEDRRTGTDAVIAANLDLVWERATQSAELSGAFTWCGDAVEGSHATHDETGHCGGPVNSPTQARRAAEDDADPDGLRNPDGEADPLRRSLWRVAQWLGIPARPGLPLGPLRIAGTLEADATSVTLSDATIGFGGNTAKGTLAFRLGGDRPALHGALDFGTLDLTPYAAAALPSDATLAEVLALPISARWLSHADVDLEVSADEVLLGSSRFAETAMTLRAREGGATLALKQATLADGRVEGAMTVRPAGEGVSADLSARLDDISVADAARFIWAAGASRLIRSDAPLLGSGTARLELAAKGATVGALVGSLEGWAVGEIRDGTIVGVDLDSTLDGLSDGKSVIAQGRAPFLPLIGETRFATWTAHVTINAGIARARQIRFEGERIRASFSAESDLRRGEVEAEGAVFLFRPDSSHEDGDERPTVELPFGVGGTILRPVIAPGIPCIGRCPTDSPGLP